MTNDAAPAAPGPVTVLTKEDAFRQLTLEVAYLLGLLSVHGDPDAIFGYDKAEDDDENGGIIVQVFKHNAARMLHLAAQLDPNAERYSKAL